MNERAKFTGEALDAFEASREAVADMALRLWQAREGLFPERVRRMKPDALDMATGAWSICVKEAVEQVRKKGPKRD